MDERPILDLEKRRFHSTSKNKASLKKTMGILQKHHPTVTFTIEPFYVNIKRVNLMTRVVTDWEKEEGFSLWFSPLTAFSS